MSFSFAVFLRCFILHSQQLYYDMPCCAFFCIFFLLEVFWAVWIYTFLVFINFRKFWPFFLQVFILSSFLGLQLCVCWPVGTYCSICHWNSVQFFQTFFSLCFIYIVSAAILKCTDLFFSVYNLLYSHAIHFSFQVLYFSTLEVLYSVFHSSHYFHIFY